MSAPIEVLDVRRVENAGNLKALATVKTGCLKIHGWRIIQQPSQRAWVSVPQEQDQQGRWHSRLEITNPSVLEAIRRAVLQAWDATQ